MSDGYYTSPIIKSSAAVIYLVVMGTHYDCAIRHSRLPASNIVDVSTLLQEKGLGMIAINLQKILSSLNFRGD